MTNHSRNIGIQHLPLGAQQQARGIQAYHLRHNMRLREVPIDQLSGQDDDA